MKAGGLMKRMGIEIDMKLAALLRGICWTVSGISVELIFFLKEPQSLQAAST